MFGTKKWKQRPPGFKMDLAFLKKSLWFKQVFHHRPEGHSIKRLLK